VKSSSRRIPRDQSEAIVEALKKIRAAKAYARSPFNSAVGTITESDVALASASNAIILGFHREWIAGVADKAKHEGVQIKLYAIIYELIDEVKEGMAGLLDPILKDVTAGVAEVRKVFSCPRALRWPGCMVTSAGSSKARSGSAAAKEIIYEGITQSLRPFPGRGQRGSRRYGMWHPDRGFAEFQIGR